MPTGVDLAACGSNFFLVLLHWQKQNTVAIMLPGWFWLNMLLCGTSSRKCCFAPELALAECASLLWQVFDTAQQELAVTGQPASSRGCKYALNTLMQTFQLKAMAANVAAGPV